MERIILHSDMNNCFASIECVLNTDLRGLRLVVGGSTENRHGIVLSKSEEAKKFGVKTGEALWEARQKCPDLVVVPPHYDDYVAFSKRAHKIYLDYTDQVEPFGLDECWLDCTGSTRLFGSGEEIANTIRTRIKKELGLTVSIGVSFNKTFSKLGSDLKKPDATTCIPQGAFRDIVWPLDVSEMCGIGRATKKKLARYGISTLGGLANADPAFLKSIFGIVGIQLWRAVNGLESSPVAVYGQTAPIKSIGHGVTCREDLVDDTEVKRVMLHLSQDISRRLIDEGFAAGGVGIFIKDNKLETHGFQAPLCYPAQSAVELAEAGFGLFRLRYDWTLDVRAVTIRAINLIPAAGAYQHSIFFDPERHEKLESIEKAIYGIRQKYGNYAITYASLRTNTKLPAFGGLKNIFPSAAQGIYYN